MLLLYIILRSEMTEKKLKTVYNKIKSSNVYDLAIKTPLDYAKNPVSYTHLTLPTKA